ncbi:relaxase/mobilization nuclease domain-containing protein, partial [Salmonella enterica]|uniref:relaxase/mobilization nuclease domain-containing protein n=1 Tax=Salmonella enterica TaxID=28901 RepID=UPI001C6053EE
MLVKFMARGKGGGSGPVDYLLGRDRQREGATVLRGDPEQVPELINSAGFSRNYTSAVLSFEESSISPELRQQCMDEFERVLLPGLDADQYSALWVEHTDKGRVELNVVIPNVELQSGKRLQP